MDIKEYKEAVEYFSNSEKDFEFTNKGSEHAATVVSNIIRTTKEELLIYSGSMDRAVADDQSIVERLSSFLESGKKLRIVLDEIPEEENRSKSLIMILESANNSTRDVEAKEDKRNIFAEALKQIFEDGIAHHFMVADGQAYRFEINAKEFKAICNFNDTTIAGKLKKSFNSLFEQI